jgi:DNA polymerase-1
MIDYIIFDATALCHFARYGMKNNPLTTEESQVEIIFIFFQYLLHYFKRFKTNKFIFCWDSRKSKRKEIYPEYKKQRRDNKTEEDYAFDAITFPQFNTLRRDILPELGFNNNLIQTGYEADDMIAMITKSYPTTSFVIVSNDKDLYQLLRNNCLILNFKSKKLYTKFDFQDDYNINPEQWVDVKAIAGCPTDNVKGVEGIGEKTAIKYLTGTLNRTNKTYLTIANSSQTRLDTERLVRLPFEDTIPRKIVSDDLKINNFVKVFEKYNFKYYLRNDNFIEWEDFIHETY